MEIFKTINGLSEEILFKEKKSKFFSQVFHVTDEEEIKLILENVRKNHPQAGHVCYAYRIQPLDPKWRANDDGEPNNSAGMPIFGQIQSYDIYDVLITVTRYFGGVKLGVGGLISAYKEAANLAITSINIIEKTIEINYTLSFNYDQMNKVMRIIKEKNIQIINQNLTENCEITTSISIKYKNHFESWFDNIFPKIKIIVL